MDNNGPVWRRDESGIAIDVEFGPIEVDVEFPISEREYGCHIDSFLELRAKRIQKELGYYFAERKPIREVARIVGVSKSQVFNDISSYRKRIVGEIKDDVRSNRVAIKFLVELIAQVNRRIEMLFDQYYYFADCITLEKIPVAKAAQRIRQNPQARIRNRDEIRESSRSVRVFMDSQRNIVAQLRAETQQLLDIYSSFGLCSGDAFAEILKDDLNFEKKIEQFRAFFANAAEIIKEEVTDAEQRRRIFNRYALAVDDVIRKTNTVKEEHEEDDAGLFA